jgi:uncharacterized protein (TIGR00251 family)
VIELRATGDGILLNVKAQAGARRNAVLGERGGSLSVAVTQAPEKGKANRAIAAVLAGALKIAKSQVELVAGETSRQKTFLLRGLTAEDAASRLRAALAAPSRRIATD